ncbi:hypothetical protein [Streptomyces sp. 8L]|uniref:hypothetical protein n=1 Tax=Streptomyces sp. 8L TaxID=2877242 RepID=UPI001CD6406D|nr:hypothetical protein [Streptomyces sp. 8L]MCA1223237.1 hypothetical protein [Streptomyces sp. 8L]
MNSRRTQELETRTPPFPGPDRDSTTLNDVLDVDQIHTARYKLVTNRDLGRLAGHNAESFLAAHPLPKGPRPGLDLAAYLDALAAVRSPAEFAAVTDHILTAVEPMLHTLTDYLLAAAQWQHPHRDAAEGSPSHMLMTAAGRALSALVLADEANRTMLRAAHDPAPTSATSASIQPATTGNLPPAPPRPGSAPRH